MTSFTPDSPRGAQEGGPEGAVLGVAHGEAEDFPVAGAGHPGGHHDGFGHHPGAFVGFDVGGVEEHVGELDVVQGPVAELGHHHVELAADAAHLTFGDPRLDPQGLDQVVDLAGRHSVDVGLHDHRPQRLVDPPAGFEQGREEAALAELGDLQVHVPGLRRQQPGPVAVAVRGAALGALVRGSANLLGRLQVDQGLEHYLHRLAHEIEIAARTQRVEQLGRGKTGQGPSALATSCA
jgi:hypothetical protein